MENHVLLIAKELSSLLDSIITRGGGGGYDLINLCKYRRLVLAVNHTSYFIKRMYIVTFSNALNARYDRKWVLQLPATSARIHFTQGK